MRDMTLYVSALLLWSALHLLWQGALMVATYSWWQQSARATPRMRSCVAMSCLVTLVAALVMNGVVAHLALLGNARLGAEGALLAEQRNALTSVATMFDRSFDGIAILALVWIIGLGFSILRLTLGAWHLSRLRNRCHAASPAMTRRVADLARRMNVVDMPRVLIAQSRLGPFVMGHAPSVLVLPSDFEAGEELDALILHELAHIRRRDRESNALLRAMQAFLWFHPAIWRLGREAVNAREESCDMEAVIYSRNATVLARALVRLEERRQTFGAMVAATDGSLQTRVQRLIGGSRPEFYRQAESGSWRTHALLLASMVILLTAGAFTARIAPNSERLMLAGATANAIPSQSMLIAATDPAGRFTLALLNGRVASATIAGVPVARPAIYHHQRTLSLNDASGQPIVQMEFDPRGTIRWMPRAPSGGR